MRIDTNLGTFAFALAVERAPATCAYFARVVEQGGFNGASIFRILNGRNGELRTDTPIHVIQGGLKERHLPFDSAIPHENTNETGITHRLWTVSAAREAVGENYPSFFVCMADEPSLDFGGGRHPDGQGFAAFGKVVRGFEILDLIYGRVEAREYLAHEIPITDAYLVSDHGSGRPGFTYPNG